MVSKAKGTNFYLFCKYSVAGIFNTFVDVGVFFLMCDILNYSEITSNVTAYICCATGSYLLNSRFVYKENTYTLKRYFQFVTGNFTVLVISTVIILFISDFLCYKFLAKIIAIPITAIMNFTIQRFLIFWTSCDKQVDKK